VEQEQYSNSTSSPCVKICRIEDNLCVGCFRTLQEIAAWKSMTSFEKIEVMELVNDRKSNKLAKTLS
jgi:predicted Fe-S protein YdhL (DUF1289 family)